MKMNPICFTLGVSMLIAGCGSLPGTFGTSGPAGAPAEVSGADLDLMSVDYALRSATGGYTVASVDEVAAPLTITSVTASSTLNSYFQADYCLDDNLHSAWAPATTDALPTLTLKLAGMSTVKGIGLKMSHANATIDVSVYANGAWKTVATGLAPVPTVLDELALDLCQGEQVRLSFHGDDLADLKVCEVKLLGTATGQTPVPSVTPSVTPSEAPDDTTGDDHDNVPCDFDGGGWLPVVNAHGTHQVTFGFVARSNGKDCDGTLEVDDLTTDTVYRGHVERVVCHGNVAMFAGTLDSGVTFTCTVVDHGRNGRPDAISFSTVDGVLFCGHLAKSTQHGGKIHVRHQAVVAVHVPKDDVRVRLEELNALCATEAVDEDEAVGPHRHHGKGKAKGHGKKDHGGD